VNFKRTYDIRANLPARIEKVKADILERMRAVKDPIDILLVYPDFRSSNVFSNPGLPVGLAFIARSLKTAGFEYEVVDLNIDTKEYLMRRISATNPRFLGISMLSYRCKETYELLKAVKYHQPQIKVIAGGPHITANREITLLECSAIDLGVIGEGEISILEIVQGQPVDSIKGLLYREAGTVRFSEEREFIPNLDTVPFPTYDGFKLAKYSKTMPLHSSRGCPYHCIFCGAPGILGKKWRGRSAQSMMEEVKYWYRKGYRSFYFSDSNFAVDKTRVASFCEGIVKSELHACFVADGLRADHVDRKLLDKMRHAGFTDLTFGVESGSNRILQNLRKGETREDIETAIAAATDLGFNVGLFFLIGSPGEDETDIDQSFELARKYNVARVYFFNLTPLPGTQVYDWAIKHGIIDGSERRYPEENFGFSKKALFRTDVLTKDQISHHIRVARRVERQVQFKYALTKVLAVTKIKRFFSGENALDSMSWFASNSIVAPVITGLWNLAVLFKKRLTAHIQ